jgi:uncharacterized membrane protein
MRVSKLKLLVLIIMSAIGFVASSYVLIVFYTLHQNLACGPTGSFFGIRLDCGAVLDSSYSKILGVPLELLALAYFMVNMALVYVIAFGSERAFRFSLQALFLWRFIGVAIVPYLVFVELFLLHAICIYCTLMHAAILIDFVVISYLLFFGEKSLWAMGFEEVYTLGDRPVTLASSPGNADVVLDDAKWTRPSPLTAKTIARCP